MIILLKYLSLGPYKKQCVNSTWGKLRREAFAEAKKNPNTLSLGAPGDPNN